MLGKIIGFELKYRFSKSMTYIFMLMMIFQAIWYVKGSFDYYINDAINFNAAGIIYQSLAGGGMLMIIAIAVITGTALFKDIEFKTAETLYSYPVSDKTWFLGKFIAAYIVNLSICLAFAIGFAVMQYTGIAEADKFGPIPWGQILHGFLIFSVPNMFILTAVALSLVVFFRTMAASYMGIFMLTMLFLVAESTRENTTFLNLIYLIDPFCFTHTRDTIDGMSIAQKNYGYFQLDTIYWINRAIWLALSGILVTAATQKFSFSYFLTKKVNKKTTIEKGSEAPILKEVNVVTNKVFGIWEDVKKLIRLSFLEFKNTVRPTGFKIIFGLLVFMFFGYNMIWNAEYYIHTDTLSITSAMTYTRLPNGVFIFLILAVFAGELLFKERSTQMWQITDTLPVPTWVTYMSKYIAMAGVALLFSLALFIPGILTQLLQGYTDFELGVYFTDLFSHHMGWLNYMMVIALAFFVGSIFSQRFVAHIITVAILLFIIVMADIGVIEQLRFAFPFTPGIEDYSEMAAYGIFGRAGVWYALMWGALSIAFLLTGIWFWNRGSIQSLASKFSLKKPQLHIIGKFSAVGMLAVFFYFQNFVVANDHDMGNFKTDAQQDAEDAEYETLFKYIETQNQPYVCGLDVTIDVNPDVRKADYSFNMLLTNKGNTPIDSLHLSLKDFVQLHSLQLQSQSLNPAWFNEKHNQLAYALQQSIAVDDTVLLKGTCTLEYKGFSSIDPQEALVYNGSFLQEDIVPRIGYNSDKELTQNRNRSDEGLEKLTSRMSTVNDRSALVNNVLSPFALRHNTTIRVRSSNAQKVTASGSYKGVEMVNNKEYKVYETEQPYLMNWQIAVANYETCNAKLQDDIQLNILYDERHTYNLETMTDAVNEGITYLKSKLGSYPYSQLTIVEIPFHNDDDFYASPNQIAISEKHCWTADGSREKDLSYIYYTLCRELFTQWIQQNVDVADVQGADMLLKAIPEAYALSFVNEKFGAETLQIYIKKKEDRYKKDRGNESNIEPPLIYADGADYLEENKGALELLKVIDEINISEFSRLLLKYNAENNVNKLVFNNFYELLKTNYPSNKKLELIEAFEKVMP
ncbi:ABC transporter permease [Saccharicrinis fermentans]|uniref:ABC-type transport system n=1 Tax=Saccharicrinis fermentans DSM 9555 = JCM 21142 TaxID=869213 RepID=W7YJI0_9BACT|nr:ABC transporter permease [Saccharicrinis fermentans]GAF04676.1 ABC-type transport system [Saccharicrinis fermentans DSM 9555 = JCM 21142]